MRFATWRIHDDEPRKLSALNWSELIYRGGCNVCREYLTRLRPVHRDAMYLAKTLREYVRDYSGF